MILHNDIDMPFAKAGAEPVYLTQMKDLLRRHPKTTIIWAHIGLGRVVHPVQGQASTGAAERSPRYREIVEAILSDPDAEPRLLRHFLGRGGEVRRRHRRRRSAARRRCLNRYPDRFLFGTDNVAPPDQATQLPRCSTCGIRSGRC